MRISVSFDFFPRVWYTVRMGKPKENRTGKKIAVLALLAGLGLVSFLLESLLPPLVLPGAKLGIANLFSLLALIFYGLPDALLVVAARTVIGSLFAGNVSLLLYSLTAGVVSVVAARLLFLIRPRVSLFCVAIASAVVHNLVQLFVYCALTQTLLLISYGPYLCLLGAAAGAVVGSLCIITLKALPRSALRKFGVREEDKI